MRMLRPLPTDRYASCRDVQLALRGMLTGDPQELVRSFLLQIRPEDPSAPIEPRRTPKPKELLETPANGSDSGNGTAQLTPRSGSNTPLLSAYLASLPRGLESFPEMQQKGSSSLSATGPRFARRWRSWGRRT